MVFGDKGKLVANEAMKEAESYAAYPFAKVVGVVKNNHSSDIMFDKYFDFTGKFITLPPSRNGGLFVHQGVTSIGDIQVPLGSKGAIRYRTYSHNPFGWLLAWQKSDDVNIPSKVYVESGGVLQIMKIDEDEILKKLDESTNISQYWDKEISHTTAFAEIKDSPGKVAFIGASFGYQLDANDPTSTMINPMSVSV